MSRRDEAQIASRSSGIRAPALRPRSRRGGTGTPRFGVDELGLDGGAESIDGILGRAAQRGGHHVPVELAGPVRGVAEELGGVSGNERDGPASAAPIEGGTARPVGSASAVASSSSMKNGIPSLLATTASRDRAGYGHAPEALAERDLRL